jgi:ribonucleotide reductase beta subunit family protein with ferritin-like domain
MYSVFDAEHVNATDKDKALAAIANIVLEGVSFPCGFIVVWALGHKMSGSAAMVTEISRNELGSHLPLYINIFKHIKEDTDIGNSVDEIARNMIIIAGNNEKHYLTYSTRGVMGFSQASIDNFVNWIIDSRLRELQLRPLEAPINSSEGLVKIFKSYSELNNTRSNFFETTVKNYSKQGLDWDDT